MYADVVSVFALQLLNIMGYISIDDNSMAYGHAIFILWERPCHVKA